MATATSTCPNCGAPLEFALGSSISKVCEYCRHTVLRSDRGLEQLGKLADLAHTPALIAVGDEGTLHRRPLRVLGRVQLDHGLGPWDEYYVAFDHGQSFGWLAYAQGQWFATAPAPGVPAPPFQALGLERAVDLAGTPFRVAEIKHAYVLSIEGEFHELIRPGTPRLYADCWGLKQAFATLDYGQGNEQCQVFVGWVFAEADLQISALGPRSQHKVKASTLRCPNCGGDVPKLNGDRSERLGCPYCGALSDIAEQRVISAQETARSQPEIAVGKQGKLEGVAYTCIAYLRRGTSFEGEPYSWEEYLLWGEAVGFRWLVKDPESGWALVTQVNLAEVVHRAEDRSVMWNGRLFTLRNQNVARVEFVLGEVFWKCSVGETTNVSDWVDFKRVLSREVGNSEVHYSLSTPVDYPSLALGFGLPPRDPAAKSGGKGCLSPAWIVIILIGIIALSIQQCASCGGSSTSTGDDTNSSYRGTGVFYGGK